ncbi:hypothetical protein JCM39194_16170 [Desulfotomaculum varum]
MRQNFTVNIPELAQFTQIIMDLTDDLITVIDQQGMIVAMNTAATRLLGVKPAQMIGRSLVQAVYGGKKFDYQGNYLSPLVETMETGREFKDVETKIKSPLLKSAFVCRTTTGLLRDAQGHAAAAYAYDKNLTEARHLERTNENLKEILHNQQLQTVLAFTEAIGTRDNYTRGHSERVAEYAQMIAAVMGLQDLSQMVYIAALVHDVGKIGIPEHILNKPGRLTEAEYQVIKQHSILGANILKKVDSFSDLVAIVRAHHERYDGSGYPDGLRGEEIPLISRIISVADAFEAMTSDRSYRRRFSIDQALAELRRCAGSQFDPAIVDNFIKLVIGTGWGRSLD